ncbi:acyl-CoA thioesterase [Microbulbifer sp. JMSA004]|uniref:acyl-CoA thioesterase n=1 Tax=unclassified Microbulbifer TaxID=2619833 RepID=UPI0024ACC13D|nr:thioesterase family protein [Microbulbifer sp. VAAF005]WHI47350.1 thioesterase family protein [Microbulbifer sp. VAAF005]
MITIKRQVLFGDCDPEGIVYTPRFSHFALEATHEAMGQLMGGPAIATMKTLGFLTPVRAFDLEFLSPVRWDTELRMAVEVSKISKHAFSFLVNGYVADERLAFRATITYVTISVSTREKIPVPDHFRELLTPSCPQLSL